MKKEKEGSGNRAFCELVGGGRTMCARAAAVPFFFRRRRRRAGVREKEEKKRIRRGGERARAQGAPSCVHGRPGQAATAWRGCWFYCVSRGWGWLEGPVSRRAFDRRPLLAAAEEKRMICVSKRCASKSGSVLGGAKG